MTTRKSFAISALLAIGLVPAAHAGDELYLRWDNCFGDGGVHNKVFACDTNAGIETLVGSFRLAATTDSVVSADIAVDLAPMGATLPSWWTLRTAAPLGCRPASLGAVFSPPATSTTCLDPWTPAGGVGGASQDTPTANYARIRAVVGVPMPGAFTVAAGQEIFAFQLHINHARTVGSPTCSGCSDPMCIAWVRGDVVYKSTFVNLAIYGGDTPANGSNVTWQTGAVATTVHTTGDYFNDYYVECQSVTPARRSTWGSIKSLYR